MEHKHSDKLDNDNSNQSGPISTSKFLDFLKLTCRVHESIILKDESGKALDYNALAKNELVNTLINSKSGQSPKLNGAEDGGSNDNKNGEYFSAIKHISIDKLELFYFLALFKTSNSLDGALQSEHSLSQKWNRSRHSFNEKSPLDTILTEKLNEVISEGILDSILPFICAANLPLQNDKLNVSHTCGLKTKSNGNTKLLSPRIVVNNSESSGTSKGNNDNNSNNRSSSKERHQRRKSSQSLGLLSEYAKYIID